MTSSISAERALIERADGLLASNDTAGAIAALQEHARRFPGGQLAVERETRWIEALAVARRTEEASERLDRFAKQHPDNPRLGTLRAGVKGSQ